VAPNARDASARTPPQGGYGYPPREPQGSYGYPPPAPAPVNNTGGYR